MSAPSRITAPLLRKFKQENRKIVSLTAYDYTMARLVDKAGADVILVGDSLGMIVQGAPTTLAVTEEQMIYHCRCVVPAVKRALVVGDMVFGSYQASPKDAVRAAARLMKEGGVAAVKLEGGARMSAAIEALSRADIPVMGHIGMTPQSYHKMGGYKVQGRAGGSAEARLPADCVLEDALAVEEAGAFAVVLECVPAELAAQITARLSIPTIGIGAGPGCDGQILVLHDMLGMNEDVHFTFVRRFTDLENEITSAVRTYADGVRDGTFPSDKESFSSEQK